MGLASVVNMASHNGAPGSEDSWPELGSLARQLEMDKEIRDRVRETGFFTRWPSTRTVGVPSVKAMGRNPAILEIVAAWWCPYCPCPKCLPIDLCRREAG